MSDWHREAGRMGFIDENESINRVRIPEAHTQILSTEWHRRAYVG